MLRTLSGLLALFPLALPEAAWAANPVSWSLERINTVLQAGTTQTIAMSFRTAEKLGNVNISVVPGLASHVQVSPFNFANVKAGDTVSFSVTLTAGTPADSMITDGVIQVRAAAGPPRVFPLPLPVQLMVQVDGGIEGADADGNGIWDYIDAYIVQNFGNRPQLVPALHQYVRAIQASLVDAADRDLSLQHAQESDRGSECVFSFYGSGNSDIWSSEMNRLVASILNTKERSLAMVVFSEHSAGQIFPSVAWGKERSSCNF